MRTKRVEKFKRYSRQKTGRFILFGIVLPMTSIFLGYIITALFILPAMKR